MSIESPSESTTPLWLRLVGIPFAALVLFVFFVFLGFPYYELADYLADHVERASGVVIEFDDVSPHLGLLGPGLRARGVTATGDGGMRFDADDIIVRPAWSLSWFALEPAIHVDLAREETTISGTVTVGNEPGWDGDVEGLDLKMLPVESFLPDTTLDGTLDATADLAMRETGIEGTIVFQVADGSIGLPGSPFGFPFERIDGDIVFGGDLFAQVNQLDLDGPMLTAKAIGNIGKAQRRGDEAVDLAVDIAVRDPNLKGVVRGLGVRVAGDGLAKVRVTGPLSKPQITRGS